MSGPDEAGLRAGAALFDAGRYRSARAAWARSGRADDPLVAGLVGYAAAVDGDGPVARAAARRARDRLAAASGEVVDLGPARASLAGDPTDVDPRPVRVAGSVPDVDALDVDALVGAATAVGAVDEAYDEAVFVDAGRYARADVSDGRAGVAALLTDVVAGRGAVVAYERLRARVERRRAEERDVDALFE